MRTRPFLTFILAALTANAAVAATAPTPPPPAKRLPPAGLALSEKDRAELTADAAALRDEIDALARELATEPRWSAKVLPDAEIFHKAVDWALRYDEFFSAKEVATARQLLAQGHERVAQLMRNTSPWLDATGLVVRGYRSRLDGSIQPYGLYIPSDLAVRSPAPKRLMVWLLGRGEKRTELAFLAERKAGPPQVTPKDTIILIPYGRFCNATKFAGEVDVFEALEAVREQFSFTIDMDRVTVAGFSMGGASTWHLAAHFPFQWCAASPGAGFAETAIYNKALAPGKEPRTAWEQTLWHWYNATDVASNLFNCPTVAYSGEIDPQKQSADLMEEAMAKEGLKLERLIGPKTEHKYHPDTKKELTARLEALADKGRDPNPHETRFTTYTLRYPGPLLALDKHWERADIRQKIDGDTTTIETKNVAAFRIDPTKNVVIDGQKIALSASTATESDNAFVKQDGKWSWTDFRTSNRSLDQLKKLPGSTGPIDDAFMDSFVFVRPTGKPLNEKVGAWVNGELAYATKMWRDIFRGDVRIRDDRTVDDSDILDSNLILWGDPSSNRIIAQILDRLPLDWNAKEIVFRGKTYDAATHAPILIFPNPLNPEHYVVLNSGIDFRNEAYGTNSLQVPKLPDYAIIDLSEAPGPRWPGKIADAGFFDESWK
jgi:dienelactone hydrolase